MKHRTILVIEVLTEDPFEFDSWEGLAYAVTEGHASGAVLSETGSQVSDEAMRGLLLAQNSDPEFLLGEEQA